MSTDRERDVGARTIADFGQQWTTYTDNDGYYGSSALFDDVFHPFLDATALHGARIAEIGSGAGRWVHVFLRAGARHIIALEPSRAIDVLRQTFAGEPDRVTLIHDRGEHLPASGDRDYVFSIGVLHHIPAPAPVCRAAYQALRPGGTFGVWVYGREGNGAYLALFAALHVVTRRLPHALLAALVRVLDVALRVYVAACRVLPLPLRGYMREVIARLTPDKRRLVIYDQLNPRYARYYSRDEATALVAAAGFSNVRVHHRHGYSWTVVGTR
jgi:SAM-dependent methyltransferase